MNTTIRSNVITPWGTAEEETVYCDGLSFFSTPGHGGFKVSCPHKLKLIKEKFPNFKTFVEVNNPYFNSGQSRWFEEDCDANIILSLWPELFNLSPDILTKIQNYIKTDKYFQ